mmetsp:Transcript_15541/g.44429  ORF Transcript_15541/g.44429 Transcript_15541/m.44429 type:complete len:169 (+) Transcript_15541:491-997(+)
MVRPRTLDSLSQEPNVPPAVFSLVAQMVCKLGGAAWALDTRRIHDKPVMVVGIDVRKTEGNGSHSTAQQSTEMRDACVRIYMCVYADKTVFVLSAARDELYLEYITRVTIKDGFKDIIEPHTLQAFVKGRVGHRRLVSPAAWHAERMCRCRDRLSVSPLPQARARYRL